MSALRGALSSPLAYLHHTHILLTCLVQGSNMQHRVHWDLSDSRDVPDVVGTPVPPVVVVRDALLSS